MKHIITLLLILLPSLCSAQSFGVAGDGRAALAHSQETRELLHQTENRLQSEIDDLRAKVDFLEQLKSPPPVGDTDTVAVQPPVQQEQGTTLRQKIAAYRSSGGRKWYVGHVGNQNRSQLIRHIQDDHKVSTGTLSSLTTDELLLLHGICHDRPSLLSGKAVIQSAAKSGHYETRLVKQCGRNGCQWVRMRVWVND